MKSKKVDQITFSKIGTRFPLDIVESIIFGRVIQAEPISFPIDEVKINARKPNMICFLRPVSAWRKKDFYFFKTKSTISVIKTKYIKGIKFKGKNVLL